MIKIPFFSRSKERLVETPPVEVTPAPELRGPQVPKTDSLAFDADTAIASLAWGRFEGKELKEKIGEKFPGVGGAEMSDIYVKVMEKRKENFG